MGRFGRHLALRMIDLGNDVMIVDNDASIIDMMSSKCPDAQIGDCTNENVLKALGVHAFDICFVTIGENFQSSLVITSLLKSLGAKCVVAKANQTIQADLLRKIGADEVIYPEKEIAEKNASYNESLEASKAIQESIVTAIALGDDEWLADLKAEYQELVNSEE